MLRSPEGPAGWIMRLGPPHPRLATTGPDRELSQQVACHQEAGNSWEQAWLCFPPRMNVTSAEHMAQTVGLVSFLPSSLVT